MNDRQLHTMPTAGRHGHASVTASVAYDAMNIARRNIPRAIPLCDALQWLPLDRYVKLLLEAKHQIEHIDTHANEDIRYDGRKSPTGGRHPGSA